MEAVVDRPASAPLKVVRVIARLNIGGPARHVVLLDHGLASRGYRTLLVHGSVGTGEGALEHLADVAGIPTLKVRGLGRDVRPGGDLAAFVRVLRTIFRESPDIVHTHTAKAGALGRIAASLFNATRGRRRRCLVVHTFHGNVLSGYFGPVASTLVRTIERCLGSLTDRIVAISSGQRADLVDRFRVVPASRAVMVPLGLDLDALLELGPGAPDLRVQSGIPATAIVVGYVGRFVPIKDVRTLIDAFNLALRECPNLWLIAAGDGPTRSDVESQCCALGIDGRVRFLGWTEDLPQLYATIDICALSSLNEGTPVALIEAMAAGKPVVATTVGGVPDLVQEHRNGILVSPRDPRSLADALLQLARDPILRGRLAGQGRLDARDRYSHRRLVADMDQIYRSALADKRGTTPALQDDPRLKLQERGTTIEAVRGAGHDQAC